MMERNRKKILHMVEALDTGGLERILATIVLGLDRNQFDVRVWCLARGGAIADELRQQGVAVEVLGISSYHHPARIFALARLMRKEGFHVVHTHGYFAGTLGRLAALLSGSCVLIHHVHSTYHEYHRRHRCIEKILSCFTYRVVCVSEAVRNFVMTREGIRREKTFVVPNGSPEPLPADMQADIGMERQLLGIGNQEQVIVTVASLTANKGHGILLDALGPVMEKTPDVSLLVVGDGPLREELTEKARALGMAPRVIWAGLRKDVFRLLRLSDLFVLPSLYREGLSLAVIEAMAVGLPVVCTNLSGMSELVRHPESGLLVPPGDAAELSGAISSLLGDSSRRKQMGRNGREIYERNFTSERMIRRIEGIYDQCLRTG